jgi:RNA polymerase sigma-70 factor (ECF subfamily)
VTKTPARRHYAIVSESDRLDSFNALYAHEFDYVWRTLGRLGIPTRDLADAVHDVFVTAYRRWDDVDHSRTVRPWLFGIARRIAANARRKNRPDPSDTADGATAQPAHAERDLLWQALSTLDDERCEVLVLHDFEGYTGVEIARMLDIPSNTVHSRLRLARADVVAAIRRLRGGA